MNPNLIEIFCPRCGGTSYTSCPFCFGTGTINNEECFNCNGEGEILCDFCEEGKIYVLPSDMNFLIKEGDL